MSITELRRDLSLFDLTMIAVGSTIGSGIFLTPALIASALPSPMWILGVWVVGGMMAMSGALTYAELGGMMPKAGGVYVFLSEAYGGLIGFLYGWAYFLVANTGAIAALAVAFSTYFGYLVPAAAEHTSIVAIGGILFVTMINVLGVKAAGVFSDLFTILKLAGIVVLIVVGLGWGSSSTTDFGAPLGFLPNGLSSALTLAFVSVLWSYGGWQHSTFTAAEAKDPRRSVPLSLIFGALVVTLVYIATNLAYLFLLSPHQMALSPRIASDAMSVVLGTFGGSLIALTIFISTFGTTGIYTLTAPRIYYAMAKDGVFFKKVSEVHPKFRTPMFSILMQSAWAIVLILFWGTFESLISYVVFTDWIFFALAAASVFIFRKRWPHAERPYKTLGYPFTPLFFITISVLFVTYTFFEKPAEAVAGLVFLAVGVPVFYFWRKRASRTAQ
ncbi:MAG: amino acid permease [Ignavibacteria bacterium]|nr:amino acid permease [Ignavibacteria bacterium]